MLDLTQYAGLIIFTGLGFAFIIGVFVMSFLFRDRGRDPLGTSTYECGMETIGTPWVSPNIRFYVFALIFVIFDIEAVFLFPWAVKFKDLGLFGFVAMMIFLLVLVVADVYAWRKGALQWK